MSELKIMANLQSLGRLDLGDLSFLYRELKNAQDETVGSTRHPDLSAGTITVRNGPNGKGEIVVNLMYPLNMERMLGTCVCGPITSLFMRMIDDFNREHNTRPVRLYLDRAHEEAFVAEARSRFTHLRDIEIVYGASSTHVE